MSWVALMGGNEFRPECRPLDEALLALAGGPARASVAVLPTAATNVNPDVAAENGVRYFERLGAAAEKVLVDDAETAADPALAAALARHRVVYITGGDPQYLLETLRGSAAWQAVLGVYRRGGLVVGSSAGAMALGGQMWRFDGWTPGLALAPQVAVLPHHATLSRRWDAAHLAATLPPGVVLVGIDDATALVLPGARVLGAGQVTLYHPGGTVAYSAGDQVPLQALLE